MATEPSATATDEAFESLTLVIRLRKVIQPYYDVVIRQVIIIEICPICSGIKGELLLTGNKIEEVQSVFGEINVIHFALRGIKCRDLKAWTLSAGTEKRQ